MYNGIWIDIDININIPFIKPKSNGWEGNGIFTGNKILCGLLDVGVRCRLVNFFMYITPSLENI